VFFVDAYLEDSGVIACGVSRTAAAKTLSVCGMLTLYGHIKTAEQRTIIRQYGT